MKLSERRAAAKRAKTSQTTSGAGGATALCEAGIGHMRAGRYLDAQVCCQQALATDSSHADSMHLMGMLSLQAQNHDLALEWFARAIRQDPKPQYLASLGTALQQQGRREEAFKVYDKAVQLKPDDSELWKCLGNILMELERFDHALLSFEHVLRLDPRHQYAAYQSGVLLDHFGRFDEAIAHFNLCDELLPNHAPTLLGRARTLFNLKRFDEALVDSRRGYELDPGNADNCNNIGTMLQWLGRYEEALQWFDRALQIRPDLAVALSNKSSVLVHLHRFDDFFAVQDRIKALKQDNAVTDWTLSHIHLLTGDFEAGLPGHEARLTLPASLYPNIPQPMWLGEEDIDGKTILICADEGLGDTIQFARYVPMLAARGARVVLAVESPLRRLLAGLPGVWQCPLAGELPAFDMHCPIGSLPLAFKTRLDTIPAAPSYLPSPGKSLVQAWEDRLGPHTGLRVGLVWSGNPTHKNDHNRSIPLQMFSCLLDLDATFVSLQKDPRADDQAFLKRTDIHDLTVNLTDFTETAALVSCLDLVISVDTSVAHLAGALGRPTWILLPWTPDHRWLLDRADSPWYPTARLFRQTETREYGSVLDRMRAELLELISVRFPSKDA
jgi:tetratricopeptide (TPR) repeat protein